MKPDDLDDIPDMLDRKINPLPPSLPKPPQPKEVPVRTQTSTKPAKLPVPPPKGVIIERPLSKKALRSVAEKAIKESNVTKLPMKGSKEAKAPAKTVKPVKAEKAPKVAKPKKAPGTPRGSNLYDWTKAQSSAESGKVPPLPPFTSYAPHFKDLHEFARKGETAEIVKYMKRFTDKLGGRKNLFRYADLCEMALNVRLTSR